VAAAAGETLADPIAGAAEIDEAQVRGAAVGAKNVAIGPLERGAGDHESAAGVLSVADATGEGAKPWNAVVVREWNAGRHARHVLGGVIFISVDEVDAECTRERGADQTLAGAGDSHHDVSLAVHDVHARPRRME
jgi:hypothetical protein